MPLQRPLTVERRHMRILLKMALLKINRLHAKYTVLLIRVNPYAHLIRNNFYSALFAEMNYLPDKDFSTYSGTAVKIITKFHLCFYTYYVCVYVILTNLATRH